MGGKGFEILFLISQPYLICLLQLCPTVTLIHSNFIPYELKSEEILNVQYIGHAINLKLTAKSACVEITNLNLI